jgi:hypothetical protein
MTGCVRCCCCKGDGNGKMATGCQWQVSAWSPVLDNRQSAQSCRRNGVHSGGGRERVDLHWVSIRSQMLGKRGRVIILRNEYGDA